jgi:hypothetical protein
MPAMPTSNIDAPSNPHGVNVGAAAASLAHVPTWPARLQRINGSVQTLSQQTLSTQNPVEHSDGVAQAPPTGMRVCATTTDGDSSRHFPTSRRRTARAADRQTSS